MKRNLVFGARRRVLAYAGLVSMAALPAMAAPIPYTLQSLIAIPTTAANVQPGGAFTSFDISYYDPITKNDYIADRSNASVDIISATTLKVIGQAQGFTGQKATTSASGADGVLTVTTGGTTTLYAGDGNSTLKVFNVTNPAAPVLLQSISTGGSLRVDEMAYSPSTGKLLVANNADAPAFGTIINTLATPNTIASTNIVIPGAAAGDGLEQPIWNPKTGTFFISVPAFGGGTDPGGVAEINTDGTVGRLFKFASFGIASCAPTGLALGASGDLLVGCGDKTSQTVLLDPAANAGKGAVAKTFTGIAGSDEIWYDPTSNDYFVTGNNTSGARIFGVIDDATQSLVQTVALPVANASNPHSITVGNGYVFVPLAGNTTAVGGNTVCALGCVAVFGQATPVPEPASLALCVGGLSMLAFWRRRTRQG